MKVLLVTQSFYPENFKSNDTAFELVRRGHEVSVLTGLPNYPKGRVFDGYGLFRKRKEVVNGVTIYRSLVIPRRKGGSIMLALNYLSFALCASIWALALALSCRFDAVLVHQTSPVTQGIPALIVKWIQRIPMYFWVLDLWPESLQAAGNINNKYILGAFTWITRLMYRNSRNILISSKRFSQSILAKGDFEDKLEYFPNWAEDVFGNISEKEIPQLPRGFRVMFAGNIGEAQDFNHVMKAALLLKEDEDIKFIIVGDGRKKAWMDEFIKENSLEKTVFMMGSYPLDWMPSFFKEADVMFLSLKDEYIFSLTVPAKLQTYMASRKPILAMINGEARNLVQEADCGLSCASGDYVAFAECIKHFKGLSENERKSLGENGYHYFMSNFTLDKCMEHLCLLLDDKN